jgi:hypothetical protein
MQTTTALTTTTTDRLAAFGDLRVVERSRGTAHPQAGEHRPGGPGSLAGVRPGGETR